MERCRKKLVAALKTGGTFALYLGGVTIEHADFKTKLCKKVRCYSYLNTNTHTQYLYILKQIIKKGIATQYCRCLHICRMFSPRMRSLLPGRSSCNQIMSHDIRFCIERPI